MRGDQPMKRLCGCCLAMLAALSAACSSLPRAGAVSGDPDHHRAALVALRALPFDSLCSARCIVAVDTDVRIEPRLVPIYPRGLAAYTLKLPPTLGAPPLPVTPAATPFDAALVPDTLRLALYEVADSSRAGHAILFGVAVAGPNQPVAGMMVWVQWWDGRWRAGKRSTWFQV